MITLSLEENEFNEVRRLLDMITRLERGSYPSAMDQAAALALSRKLGAAAKYG